MTRTKHPNKEIEAALKYAEEYQWRIENSNGHPFGQMYCPIMIVSKSVRVLESGVG